MHKNAVGRVPVPNAIGTGRPQVRFLLPTIIPYQGDTHLKRLTGDARLIQSRAANDCLLRAPVNHLRRLLNL